MRRTPAFNTESSGVSFSVFSIENDWRQGQVPPPLTILATIWTLTPVQQLSFLPPGACHKRHPPPETPTILPRSAQSDKHPKRTVVCPFIPWYQHHFHFITRPVRRTLHCGLPCNKQRIWVSSIGRFLFRGGLDHLVKTKDSACLDEYLENCLVHFPNVLHSIRFRGARNTVLARITGCPFNAGRLVSFLRLSSSLSLLTQKLCGGRSRQTSP